MSVPAAGRRGVLLLAGGLVALLAGLWGALALLGLDVPASSISASDHGMLMSLGFLGTMIAVERAVALARMWAWAAPALSGAATVWLLTGGWPAGGKVLLIAAGALLLVVYAALQRIQPSLHNALMGLAAIGWIAAAALWLSGRDIALLVPWLAVFLVVTIAAERLELSRLIGATRRARVLLIAAAALLVLGAAVSTWLPDPGVRIGGVALAGLAAWLASNDLARRTVRRRGITRFMAVGLLAGYAWLAVAGATWIAGGSRTWGSLFDAQIHALFLGFIMSMVFAHAPVIAPAVLRRPVPYHPVFYVHLALLHASLLVRLVGGDVLGSRLAWQVGGVLNEIALLGFLGVTVVTIVRARDRASSHIRLARPIGVAGVGVLAGALVAVGAVALDHRGGSGASGAPLPATVRTVHVDLREMRIAPSSISVAPGTHLVLEVRNSGAMQHDLALSTGARTPLLSPGEHARLDAGAVAQRISGWCTVAGHRAAGMTLTIDVSASGNGAASTRDATSPDLAGTAQPGWQARDAWLGAAPAGRVHRVTWHIRDVSLQVAPGVTQQMWTFDGTVPGPVLHGRVGDTFAVTVVNDDDMAHSLDFHAMDGPPDTMMRPVPPGGRVTYRFTAQHAGAWLYHCGTDPMLMHVGNGMYGALIVEPDHLAPVAAQYVLVASELYFGPEGGTGDYAKMLAARPDAVVYNGYPYAYVRSPIDTPVGQPIRIWVVDAGPSRSEAFHVVGAPFQVVYLDGGYLVPRGSSGAGATLPLDPGDGGFAELTFTMPGRYPFLSHSLADAAMGASGVFAATG